jgi:hypothetical protein
MGYGLDSSGLIPGISLPWRIQTGTEAHLTSYPTGTGIKGLRHEVDHSPPSSATVKNGGAVPPLPHTSSWCGS